MRKVFFEVFDDELAVVDSDKYFSLVKLPKKESGIRVKGEFKQATAEENGDTIIFPDGKILKTRQNEYGVSFVVGINSIYNLERFLQGRKFRNFPDKQELINFWSPEAPKQTKNLAIVIKNTILNFYDDKPQNIENAPLVFWLFLFGREYDDINYWSRKIPDEPKKLYAAVEAWNFMQRRLRMVGGYKTILQADEDGELTLEANSFLIDQNWGIALQNGFSFRKGYPFSKGLEKKFKNDYINRFKLKQRVLGYYDLPDYEEIVRIACNAWNMLDVILENNQGAVGFTQTKLMHMGYDGNDCSYAFINFCTEWAIKNNYKGRE
jgi:hypothetical protein